MGLQGSRQITMCTGQSLLDQVCHVDSDNLENLKFFSFLNFESVTFTFGCFRG